MKFSTRFDDSGLKRLRRNAENLGGEQQVQIGHLFPNDFMARNTKYKSIEAFLDGAGINSVETVQQIFSSQSPQPKFEKFVARNSTFKSFQEMLEAATAQYARKRLGL